MRSQRLSLVIYSEATLKHESFQKNPPILEEAVRAGMTFLKKKKTSLDKA